MEIIESTGSVTFGFLFHVYDQSLWPIAKTSSSLGPQLTTSLVTGHEARFIARVDLQAMPNRSVADRASIWQHNIAKYNIVEYYARSIKPLFAISRWFQTMEFNIISFSLWNKRFEKFWKFLTREERQSIVSKIRRKEFEDKRIEDFYCENQNFIFEFHIYDKNI